MWTLVAVIASLEVMTEKIGLYVCMAAWVHIIGNFYVARFLLVLQFQGQYY